MFKNLRWTNNLIQIIYQHKKSNKKKWKIYNNKLKILI